MASLVTLGIATIAPIFGLFLSGDWLRLVALIFAVMYLKQTVTEATFGVRILLGKVPLRADAPNPEAYRKFILGYIGVEVVQFFAMLTVLAYPATMLLLIWSIVFLYAGYQCVLSRYIIERQPFQP